MHRDSSAQTQKSGPCVRTESEVNHTHTVPQAAVKNPTGPEIRGRDVGQGEYGSEYVRAVRLSRSSAWQVQKISGVHNSRRRLNWK